MAQGDAAKTEKKDAEKAAKELEKKKKEEKKKEEEMVIGPIRCSCCNQGLTTLFMSES
jgi:hypothetical protein